MKKLLFGLLAAFVLTSVVVTAWDPCCCYEECNRRCESTRDSCVCRATAIYNRCLSTCPNGFYGLTVCMPRCNYEWRSAKQTCNSNYAACLRGCLNILPFPPDPKMCEEDP
ncbi:hypothetical protein COT48_05395 [Candidatus Woesearchaeota archaeon CG08_land_8_20_14_0_20_47_9]|nr:MAG: hypothetical protein AUJ69_01945 [Candidatus Woesearchaeota archaeon CG1_02_47_18]PIO03334.1 MAG: hypothetical protein COT48_05395 [Candidatus Woesearchaeota archaeon CG08_land_8_20_14_0_20_47_9]HII30030.1 hypothetical protein [Candidatus Woesearchaeota archaeon]